MRRRGRCTRFMEAQVIRLSLVDDGAYPQSSIKLRVDPMAAVPVPAAVSLRLFRRIAGFAAFMGVSGDPDEVV